MLRAVVFVLGVLGSVAVAREADACSGRCVLAGFPADGKTLPAGFTLMPVPFTGTLDIRDATDTSVFEGSTRSGLVDFGTPLPEGKYTLKHTPQGCGDATTERTFSVGPAAPFPSSAGQLKNSAVTQVPARAGEDGVGACDPYGAPRLASTNVWLEPSAELVPHLPLARFEVVVDGTSLGLPQYVTESGSAVARTSLVVACETPPMGWRQTGYVVTAGKHQVEIRGELVDGKTLPVARGDVELACADGAASYAPLSTAPGAGCSASSRSSTGEAGTAVLVFVLGHVWRRRRRSRSSSSSSGRRS